jgi:pyrethroid hydrolase
MQPPCELRIIRVTWARKDYSTDVQTAQEPIPLEHDGHGWVAEVPAYPKLEGKTWGQLAVALSAGTSEPCLLRANDAAFPLTPIRAPDGRDWWIEKGEWGKAAGGGYHNAPLCSHAGEARLRVDNHLVRLRISPTGFTAAEFETLLDEFRNGAWQLILDPMSPTGATDRRGDGGIDPAFLDAVSAFLRYAGRALSQPHRELREERQLQRIERVRPHAGTFRELAVRASPRLVSGRGHAPSFNTPENRQLLAMCSRLRRTLQGLLAGSKGAASDFVRRAQADDRRADEMQKMIGLAKVDDRRLARLIDEKASDLRNYPGAVLRLLTPAEDVSVVHRVEACVTRGVNWEHGEHGFWSKVLSIDGQQQGSRSFRFAFVGDVANFEAVFRKGFKYSFEGSFQTVRKPQSDDQHKWWKARVLFLTKVDSNFEQVIARDIRNLCDQRAFLARQGFLNRLSDKDAQEQRQDVLEARRSAARLRTARDVWEGVAEQLAPLADRLSALECRALNLGIKVVRHAGFTGSMTWVTNPDYRGALGAFRKALDRAGLKASELDGLLRLQDLGILDLPMVYERWCLLRIIALLREHFLLTPPADLRERLLGSVTAGGALSLRFAGPAIGRDVLLAYQPRLWREGVPEKQRPNPDFMLTVSARDDERPIHGRPRPSLVLDAKCKPFRALGEEGSGLCLVEELDELIGRKGYHHPGDQRVFVLHPGSGPGATERVVDYCHFGGSYLVPNGEDRKPWDQGTPDHRYGAVLLRPRVTDPLARLILMHLYLGLDDSLGAYTKRPPAWPLICPACGGAEMTQEPPPGTPTTEHPGRASWCGRCGRMLVWNFSGDCGTHLFKLGGHWTFHDTHPLNPYNIRCPHCGDFMSLPAAEPEPDGFGEPYDWGELPWPP